MPLAFFDSFLAALFGFKYTALFVVSFLAAFAMPLPTSTYLAASAAFAAQGQMNIYMVLLVALAGNVSADLTGYLLARHFGVDMLKKIGFGRIIRSDVYKRMEVSINSYSHSIIYVSRLFTEAGPAVNVLAGLARVPYSTFIIFDILGESCFVLLYGLAGYFLGTAWESNEMLVVSGFAVFASIGLIAVMIQLLRSYIKK